MADDAPRISGLRNICHEYSDSQVALLGLKWDVLDSTVRLILSTGPSDEQIANMRVSMDAMVNGLGSMTVLFKRDAGIGWRGLPLQEIQRNATVFMLKLMGLIHE